MVILVTVLVTTITLLSTRMRIASLKKRGTPLPIPKSNQIYNLQFNQNPEHFVLVICDKKKEICQKRSIIITACSYPLGCNNKKMGVNWIYLDRLRSLKKGPNYNNQKSPKWGAPSLAIHIPCLNTRPSTPTPYPPENYQSLRQIPKCFQAWKIQNEIIILSTIPPPPKKKSPISLDLVGTLL